MGNHRTERPPDPVLYGSRPSGGYVNRAVRGLGSIPTWGNILSLEFFCFHAVKRKMPILEFLCVCEKPDCTNEFQLGFAETRTLYLK